MSAKHIQNTLSSQSIHKDVYTLPSSPSSSNALPSSAFTSSASMMAGAGASGAHRRTQRSQPFLSIPFGEVCCVVYVKTRSVIHTAVSHHHHRHMMYIAIRSMSYNSCSGAGCRARLQLPISCTKHTKAQKTHKGTKKTHTSTHKHTQAHKTQSAKCK